MNVLVFVSFYSWGVSWHHPMRHEDRVWARRQGNGGGNGDREGAAPAEGSAS